MERCKLFHIVLGWGTLLSLLIAGCAPAVAPTPTSNQIGVASQPETPTAKPTSAQTAAPTPTSKPAAEQPKYGGILNIGHYADPMSYDPIQELSLQSVSLVVPCYSGIVQHDPLEPTKVIGDLAEKWEMSSDGLTYTFHFYKDVRWHDGSPLTSEDARFSMEVVRKPPKGVISPKQSWLMAADKIESADKDTLRMTLQYPSASFLHNMGDGRMVVVPKNVFEAKGGMKRDIVGTGPYKFKSFMSGATFNVVKNADYFVKGRPYLDGITWYIISDVATRFAALRTNRIQTVPFASQGLTPSQSDLIRRELSDKIIVYKYPGVMAQNFWMLHTKAPWNDIRVRRAVELTIDRQKVIKVAAEGVGDVGGHMPPGVWSLPEAELSKMPGYRQPKDADIAEAKRLMAEAGYAQGFKTTAMTRGDAKIWERSVVAVKEQLAQIGIEVTIVLKDQATLTDLGYKRSFETLSFAGGGSYDDPDQVFGQAIITGLPRNFGDFSDEKIDKWYDEQARAMDQDKRKQIVLDMQRRMHELVACSRLWWYVYELGHWAQVKDFRAGIGMYNNMKFQNVWLAQ